MIIWLASYPKSGNTWMWFFIKSYFNPKCIVINSYAKKHLESLCKQTSKEFEIAKTYYKEKNLKIKHLKTDLSMVQKNKIHLALRWLNVSFKQLFTRKI